MLSSELNQAVRDLRMRFLDQIQPHRPDLYRTCRSLTGSVWDAEDLCQDTLLRAFAKLGELHHVSLDNPRAWLLRVATNAWIDRSRKQTPLPLSEPSSEPAPAEPGPLGPQVRDALTVLVRNLPPQERAAVLLKDVFGLSLREVARALDTTTNAIKAALHRGRRRLARAQESDESTTPRRPAPPTELVDRFVDAFNARDLERLAGLLNEDAEAEVVGMVHELGREAIRDGSLHHTLFDEVGEPRAERVLHESEALVLIWYRTSDGSQAVGDVLRFSDEDGAIRSLRYYYFCPETLVEVTTALGLPCQTNGYRYPTSETTP